MATKKYDVAVKVGEYTNASGKKRNKYQNIGKVMEGNDGHIMILNALMISPQLFALANRERKDSIIVSLFEPKEYGSSGSSGDDPF